MREGLEPPTSSLSETRSNQLSYRTIMGVEGIEPPPPFRVLIYSQVPPTNSSLTPILPYKAPEVGVEPTCILLRLINSQVPYRSGHSGMNIKPHTITRLLKTQFTIKLTNSRITIQNNLITIILLTLLNTSFNQFST